MGYLAKAAGAEAIGQHVCIVQIANGGQAEIGLAIDHARHGARNGVDGDLDSHIGVERINPMDQIDEGACLVGVDKAWQFTKVGLDDADRLGRGAGGGRRCLGETYGRDTEQAEQ